jgi:hypothetical protein
MTITADLLRTLVLKHLREFEQIACDDDEVTVENEVVFVGPRLQAILERNYQYLPKFEYLPPEEISRILQGRDRNTPSAPVGILKFDVRPRM